MQGTGRTLELCWLVFGTAQNVFLAFQRYIATIAIGSKYQKEWRNFAREWEWIKIHQIILGKFVHEQQQYSIIKECVSGIMGLGIRGWI